jgi:hypothetical protein
MDFLKPRLESYLSETVRRTDITKLEAAPVLFHSGYLTLEKVTMMEETAPDTGKTELVKSFSFRLPNFEVSSSYYRECFAEILGLKSGDELGPKGKALKEAILSRNATAVQTIFSDILGTITYHQRPEGEDIFHSLVQAIIRAMGLMAYSELAGPKGRLDLAVNLGKRVYGVIELKYCPINDPQKKDVKLLAALAVERLPKEEWEKVLADAARQKLKIAKITQILSATPQKQLSEAEANHLLAQDALTSLAEEEINKVLAKMAREKLFQDDIDNALSKAAQSALDAIKDKNYHAVLKLDAAEFIDLGMAVYGYGDPIKVVFAPPPNQA